MQDCITFLTWFICLRATKTKENRREQFGNFSDCFIPSLPDVYKNGESHHCWLRHQHIFSSLNNCHIVPFECFSKGKQWWRLLPGIGTRYMLRSFCVTHAVLRFQSLVLLLVKYITFYLLIVPGLYFVGTIFPDQQLWVPCHWRFSCRSSVLLVLFQGGADNLGVCTRFDCGLHILDFPADSRGMQHRTRTAVYQGTGTAATNLLRFPPQAIVHFLLLLAMSEVIFLHLQFFS